MGKMISGDDIDAFKDENIKAAREYARRARKGIPSDRWTDGAAGAKAVADGIDALDWCLGWCVQEIEKLRAQIKQSGADAMEVHRDPMR